MEQLPGTKGKIARAALTLFVQKGVTETTIRDITGAVGITEGALYRHYTSKDALAWELYATNYEALGRELRKVRLANDYFPEQLAGMIAAVCALFDRDPDLFSYLLLAQHQETRKIPDDMITPVEELLAAVTAALAIDAIQARSPEIATAAILGIVLQTATFKVYGRIEDDLAALAPELTAACLRAVEW